MSARNRSFRGVRFAFASLFFGIAGWLVAESYRVPPAEDSLSFVGGRVASVKLESRSAGRGGEYGKRLVLRVRGYPDAFTFDDDDPGYGNACTLAVNDEVEMRVDNWLLRWPGSLQVYAMKINGNVSFAYEHIAPRVERGSSTCAAVMFVLLGIGALRATISERTRGVHNDE